jgi:hypothetical protein
VTVKGYDTMTGVGTPNGAAFITGLRRAADCSQLAPERPADELPAGEAGLLPVAVVVGQAETG